MIKSSKDTRYAIDSVVTHDGVKFPCWALPDLTSFRNNVGEDAYEKVNTRASTLSTNPSFFFFPHQNADFFFENLYKYFFWMGGLRQLDVIGIDEAQFFEDLYDFCCKAADNDGKTVVLSGLDGDYLR